jgi:hypothetical protein
MEPKDIENLFAEDDFMYQTLNDLHKEHLTAFESYCIIARLSEDINKEIYNIALQKAAGHRLMIKEYEKRLKKYNK